MNQCYELSVNPGVRLGVKLRGGIWRGGEGGTSPWKILGTSPPPSPGKIMSARRESRQLVIISYFKSPCMQRWHCLIHNRTIETLFNVSRWTRRGLIFSRKRMSEDWRTLQLINLINMQYILTQLYLQVFSSFFIASIPQLTHNLRVTALRLPLSLPIRTHMSSGKMSILFNANFLIKNIL